ncbi:MAG TPA: metalloregulator ArsR/SmtB family transcription factor [Caulobacteraceae bacterium]|nr:metalloregulator ArsR/SmtB family transcription factor [Caulobacteraceae bacterium]
MSAAAAKPGEAVDAIFAALADPHRRRVVDLLSRGPRPAGELAREVGLAPPAMSRHLKTLRRSGLVEEFHPDFDARVRVYVLKAEAMDELKRWLDETERMWAEQLTAFKAHLEKGAA